LESWLLEHGGPAIQLRLSALRNPGGAKNDADNAVSALLDIDEVHSVLDKFNGFQTPDRDKKTLEHLIHYYKDTCIDNFFPLAADMGFRSGITAFDEKMAPVADIFRYLLAFADEYDHCYFYAGMLHRFFFMSGCLFPELVESMGNRLRAIHKAAEEKIFDIYQDESKLPKKPKIWAEIGVLKDELNPFKPDAEKPLPSIYDIWALAYYQGTCAGPEETKKIDDIITYILEPEFQNIREGYGLLWVGERRIYHACGWSPTLPLYGPDGAPVRLGPFPAIDCLDFMSRFKAARKSEWFRGCLDHFERFKTEKGTYLFPNEYHYLRKKYIDKAFLNEAGMAMKRDGRGRLKRELAGTMKIVEIYSRIS
jgi:hypothetical protein